VSWQAPNLYYLILEGEFVGNPIPPVPLEWYSPSAVSGQMIMPGSAPYMRSPTDATSVYTYEHYSLPTNEKDMWLAKPSDRSESVQEKFWSNAVKNLLNDRRTTGTNHPTTDFVPPRLANRNNSCWMNAALQVNGACMMHDTINSTST
jgi:hypothetical protein